MKLISDFMFREMFFLTNEIYLQSYFFMSVYIAGWYQFLPFEMKNSLTEASTSFCL